MPLYLDLQSSLKTSRKFFTAEILEKVNAKEPLRKNPLKDQSSSRKPNGKVSRRKTKLICRGSKKKLLESSQVERAYNVCISLEVQN